MRTPCASAEDLFGLLNYLMNRLSFILITKKRPFGNTNIGVLMRVHQYFDLEYQIHTDCLV